MFSNHLHLHFKLPDLCTKRRLLVIVDLWRQSLLLRKHSTYANLLFILFRFKHQRWHHQLFHLPYHCLSWRYRGHDYFLPWKLLWRYLLETIWSVYRQSIDRERWLQWESMLSNYIHLHCKLPNLPPTRRMLVQYDLWRTSQLYFHLKVQLHHRLPAPPFDYLLPLLPSTAIDVDDIAKKIDWVCI